MAADKQDEEPSRGENTASTECEAKEDSKDAKHPQSHTPASPESAATQSKSYCPENVFEAGETNRRSQHLGSVTKDASLVDSAGSKTTITTTTESTRYKPLLTGIGLSLSKGSVPSTDNDTGSQCKVNQEGFSPSSDKVDTAIVEATSTKPIKIDTSTVATASKTEVSKSASDASSTKVEASTTNNASIDGLSKATVATMSQNSGAPASAYTEVATNDPKKFEGTSNTSTLLQPTISSSNVSNHNLNPIATGMDHSATPAATATNITASASIPVTTSNQPVHPNPEESVKTMVHNIIMLLETRGPLTMGQLEYNLPVLILGKNSTMDNKSAAATIASTGGASPASAMMPSSSILDSTGPISATTPNTKNNNDQPYQKLVPGNVVPDIVEVLVALGVVQQEDMNATTATSGPVNELPRYAIAGGKPRQFIVTPTNILEEIGKAKEEVESSLKRQELLRQALNPSTSDKHASQILEQIAMQYPQAVADDPVYVTALRNMHVDVVAVLGKYGNLDRGIGRANSTSLTQRRQHNPSRKRAASLSQKRNIILNKSAGMKRGQESIVSGSAKANRENVKKATFSPNRGPAGDESTSQAMVAGASTAHTTTENRAPNASASNSSILEFDGQSGTMVDGRNQSLPEATGSINPLPDSDSTILKTTNTAQVSAPSKEKGD